MFGLKWKWSLGSVIFVFSLSVTDRILQQIRLQRYPPSNHIGQRHTHSETSPLWTGAKITQQDFLKSKVPPLGPLDSLSLSWQCGAVVWHCVGFRGSLLLPLLLHHRLGAWQASHAGSCPPWNGCMSPDGSHPRAWGSSGNLDSEWPLRSLSKILVWLSSCVKLTAIPLFRNACFVEFIIYLCKHGCWCLPLGWSDKTGSWKGFPTTEELKKPL